MGDITSDQRHLLDLQLIDSEMRGAHERIETLPKKIAAQRKSLADAESEVATLKTRSEELAVISKDCESEIKTHEAKIANLEKQLMMVQNQRQMEAVQAEIDNLKSLISGHEDTELETIDEQETVTAQIAEWEEKVASLQTETTGEIQRLENLLDEAKRTAEVLIVDRERTFALLPPPLQMRYNQLNDRHRGNGIVRVERPNICGGCHMELVMHTMQMVEANTDITACEHCGRILIPAE